MILLIPEHNRMGFMLGIPGLVLQTASPFLTPVFEPAMGTGAASALTLLFRLCGIGLLIGGLSYVAKAKGYHWAYGFLGLLSCIGLIIMAVLPDKSASQVPYYGSFGGPPQQGGPGWGVPQGYTPPAPPQNPYAAPNQQGWGQPPQQGGWGGPQGGQGPQGGGQGPQGGGWGGGGWGGPPPA